LTRKREKSVQAVENKGATKRTLLQLWERMMGIVRAGRWKGGGLRRNHAQLYHKASMLSSNGTMWQSFEREIRSLPAYLRGKVQAREKRSKAQWDRFAFFTADDRITKSARKIEIRLAEREARPINDFCEGRIGLR
jgi:hypothetical protein